MIENDIKFKTFGVGSFQTNTSILSTPDGTFVIDPGCEARRIIEELGACDQKPRAILLTHAHFDHIGAIEELQQHFPNLSVFVSSIDAAIITHPANQYPPEYPQAKMPANIHSTDEFKSEGINIEVITTPGHTPGGVCYYLPQANLLFSGDTLFAGSIGRTDLPGGDMERLMDSLGKLKALPPETKVIPGHGPFTTIGDELDCNPFLQ